MMALDRFVKMEKLNAYSTQLLIGQRIKMAEQKLRPLQLQYRHRWVGSKATLKI